MDELRKTRRARVDRAEIRFAIGAATGPQSQAWVVRSRIERFTGATQLLVGPSRALRTATSHTRDPDLGVVIPDDDLNAEWARLREPMFTAGPAGVEVVPGWRVAAVIVIPPTAVNHVGGRASSPRPTYHRPPRQGRVFQAVVACAEPGAELLSIAAANDAGLVRLPGAPPVRVWINHVPPRPEIGQMVRAARRWPVDRPSDLPEGPGFVHATTEQNVPILLDLGARANPDVDR